MSVFKNIPGFPWYSVSEDGILLCWRKQGGGILSEPKVMKPGLSSRGYRTVCLYRDKIAHTKKVAFVVLLTFVSDRPRNTVISHLDGNRLNDKLSNLKWETQKDNVARKVAHGTMNFGERHGRAKLTKQDVINILEKRSLGWTYRALVKHFNIGQTQIGRIVRKEHWQEALNERV
jgi:hypothetical protein